MKFVVELPPTKQVFIENMELKMQDSEFIGDTMALLRPDENYSIQEAYLLIKQLILDKIAP